jgi:hypothetical protein
MESMGVQVRVRSTDPASLHTQRPTARALRGCDGLQTHGNLKV